MRIQEITGRSFIWGEASGGQQTLRPGSDAEVAAVANDNDELVVREDELNDDERKIIADLDAGNLGGWSGGDAMIDTADEMQLLHYARVLGIALGDSWQGVADMFARGDDDNAYEEAEELMDDEATYEQMEAIIMAVKERVRFVALNSLSDLKGY